MKSTDYIFATAAGIEYYLFGSEEMPGAPVVFVTHGRGGAAEHTFDWCRDLRARGMIAIALDQRNHGRRLVDEPANGNWDIHHAANMYGNMLGTAQDVSMLIDILPAYGLQMSRVGMTGGSMGGHATLLAMALDKRIFAGAAMIGGGDYRHLMELRAAANGTAPADFEKYFPAALAEMVRKFDPINNLASFIDRPLLMTNGEIDELVQISANRRFEAALRPLYTRPERLQLSAYPGIGHAIPAEMWQESLDWLQRWLLS